MRRASRLSETGRPLRTSHTATPTGEVSISASRSARAPLGAVGARVGDRAGGLGGEHHQDILVLVRERFPVLFLHEIEVSDVRAEMAHRRALEGLRRQALGGEAEAADIGRNVGNAQRPVEVAEVLEQARPVGPLRHGPVLLGGEAGGDEVHGRPGLVDGGDGTVARAGQGAGAFGDLAQHGVEVEAGCDAQARRAAFSRRSSSGPVTAASRPRGEGYGRRRPRQRGSGGATAMWTHNSRYSYLIQSFIHAHITLCCVLLSTDSQHDRIETE